MSRPGASGRDHRSAGRRNSPDSSLTSITRPISVSGDLQGRTSRAGRSRCGRVTAQASRPPSWASATPNERNTPSRVSLSIHGQSGLSPKRRSGSASAVCATTKLTVTLWTAAPETLPGSAPTAVDFRRRPTRRDDRPADGITAARPALLLITDILVPYRLLCC